MFPIAFRTASVAHALFTTWCAKKPGKSESYCPLAGSEEEPTHLKRKINACNGCKSASEAESSEYRSSTTKGTPKDLSSSLKET